MLVHGVIFRKKPFHVSTVRLQVGTFCKVICEASVEGGSRVSEVCFVPNISACLGEGNYHTP